MLDIVMKFFGKNPPSILILGGILLIILSAYSPDVVGRETLSQFAYLCLFAGVFLQVLWLIMKAR